jgi:DNA-binding XRE family transcriptional regulator
MATHEEQIVGGTYTDRQRKSLNAMTPEQRARVEAIREELRTPEARARHAAIRERFADRPTREELIRRGEIDPEKSITMGGLAALHHVLAELRRAREGAGLSSAEVARRAGIDPASMSRLESGRNANPTFETLTRYAAALGKRISLVVEDQS